MPDDPLPHVPNPHGIEYWGDTVEMSDGSERPLLGAHERPTGERLAAIEAYLIETRRLADEARADTKDRDAPTTGQRAPTTTNTDARTVTGGMSNE